MYFTEQIIMKNPPKVVFKIGRREVQAEYYHAEINKEGPLFVFFRGFPGVANRLEALVEELGNHGFRVLIPDYPGLSTARSIERFNPDTVLNTMDGLLNQLEMNTNPQIKNSKKFILGGHSFGTVLASLLGAKHASNLLGLMVMAPHTDPGKLYNKETPEWFLDRIKKSIEKEWLAFSTDFFKDDSKIKEISGPVAREKYAKELYAKELHKIMLKFGENHDVKAGISHIAKNQIPIAVYSAVGDKIVPNWHSEKAIEIAGKELPRKKTAHILFDPADHEFFNRQKERSADRTKHHRAIADHFGNFYKKNKPRRH